MTDHWFVIQTEPLREPVVEASLKRAGFTSYLPRLQDRFRISPLFPRYLFVAQCEFWYSIANTMGVRTLLMSGGHPARLPHAIIAEIQGREDGNGVIQAPHHKRGQRVAIVRGPFEGRMAVYVGMTSKEREKVLIRLLGQYVPIDLPARNLAPPHGVRCT